MIKSITIRDVASYDHEGVTFFNLKKVNFIYGGNGTGKTTLSRVLASEKPTTEFPDCRVEWDGRYREVLVYNQDFKRNSLTEQMPGIFTLGANRKFLYWELQNRYARLRSEIQRKDYDPFAQSEMELALEEELSEQARYSVTPAIDNINHTLDNIGFTGFRIRKTSRNAYTYKIVRHDGHVVGDTLSEGEVTIITFLYYLQMVEGISCSSNPKGKKVLVIDDPISSLDYDALEVVSTLTNKLMVQARYVQSQIDQVILLTHNITFHQSLAVRQPANSACYFKLYKKKGVSCVTAYGTLNPVHGDYEELWLKLREAAESNNSIVMPNLMRRIIETYFVDYGGYDKNKFFAGGYVEHKADRPRVVELTKWADEGSHGVTDNRYFGDAEMHCERFMTDFEQLFTIMGHHAHYNMMMRL